MGQTRVNYREAQKLMTLLINSIVGVCQFFTITFMFVGWFWSIAWGGTMIIYAGSFAFYSKLAEELIMNFTNK